MRSCNSMATVNYGCFFLTQKVAGKIFVKRAAGKENSTEHYPHARPVVFGFGGQKFNNALAVRFCNYPGDRCLKSQLEN